MELTQYYENIDDTMFCDKDMCNAVKMHVEDMATKTSSYTTLDSRKTFFYESRKVFIKFFKTTKLRDLSHSYILDLFTYTSFESGEVLFLNRFLVNLLELGYIKDAVLLRLILFKERICTWSIPEDVIRILTNSNFERYAECNFFTDTQSMKLFLMDFPKENFIDHDLYNALLTHFEDVKLNSHATTMSKVNECYALLKVIQIFFSNVTINNINREYIYNCMKFNEEIIKSGHILQLSKALLYLISLGLIIDNHLCHLSELSDYLKNGVKKETYLMLLENPNIDKYVLLPAKISNIQTNYLIYVNIDNSSIRKAWIEFALPYTRNLGFRKVCEEFDISLNGFDIQTIENLDFDTFKAQLHYFKQYNNINYISPITAFYLYVHQNYNEQIFNQSHIDIKLLQRQYIAQEILNGYEVVSYNPIEDIPKPDKWLFCYSGMEDTNGSVITTASKSIDFTRIKSTTYRDWYKHYIWHNNTSLVNKLHAITPLIYFLNYIYDLKNGNVLSIYTRKTNDETITLNEIFAYKNHILNIKDNNRTRNSYIYIPRALLTHVSENELANIESGIFYHLSFTLSSDYDNAEAISDENLKKLSSLMKKYAEESVENSIYYSIFYIALETEFRGSQILSLTTDCVEETSKPNEYIINSKTKISAGEIVEQPITIYVKKHIDEIIKLTENYRNACQLAELKKYIFLVPTNKKATYGILSSFSFNGYLKNCCKEIGIKEYTFSNLRDTHMTKAEEFIIRNSMSEIEQSILSGHKSSNTDTKHYIDTQIKELLESVHGVVIGNVNIEGQIIKEIPKDIATNENSVSNQCGYCRSKSCNNFSYLDCILCKDFITTIDRIPYFEEQIKVVDRKIREASIKHDKEDCVNIKLLLLNYLKELLKLKGAEYE